MRTITSRHRFISPLVGMVILGLTAGVAVAGGATQAGARIIDGAGQTIGWAQLTEDAAGQLHLNVQVSGLTVGRHGIHLHAVGQCVGPTFASAGGHHDPLGAEHGLDNPAGAHAGDLPNLVVNVAGRGHLDAVSHRATLSSGPVSLLDAGRLGHRDPRIRGRPGDQPDRQQRSACRLRRDRGDLRTIEMQRGARR